MKKINFFTATLITILIFILNDSEKSFAQQAKLDSLFNLVDTDKPACAAPCMGDTARINHLNGLAWELKYADPDTAIVLSTEALHLSENIKSGQGSGWQMGMGQSLHQLGAFYWITGDYPESLQYYSDALLVWDGLLSLIKKNEKDSVYAIEVMKKKSTTIGSIGNIYMNEGDLVKALEYYLQSLSMDEALGNQKGIARNLGNIGAVYSDMPDYPKALDYFFRAMAMNDSLGNKDGIAKNLGNIGSVYMEQGDYPRALDNYFKAVQINDQLGNLQGLASQYDKIGNVYSAQKEFGKAVEFYFKALTINETTGDQLQIAAILANIGASLTDAKEYAKGKTYLLRALALADTVGYLSLKQKINQNLSTLAIRTGDYKSALEYYENSVLAADSLFNQEKDKEITGKILEYEFEKKTAAAKAEQDKKDALAAAAIGRQTLIKNIILGAMGIAALLVFLAVRSFNRRKKLSFEKTVSEVETKALRSQMNPHFISNSLQSINKYIIDNEKENASEYLSRFAKLMRMILENSRAAEVTIENDLQALELYLQLESLRFKNKFKYEIEVGKDIDPANTMIPPLLLQPFVENSILHGLRTIDNGMIKIKVNKEGSMIRCTVEDNGIGREQSVKLESGEEKRESLGMKITLARLEVINQLKKVSAAINVFDLKNKENIPAGLRVELLLPFETAF